jgi:hypothetical protein
VSGWKKPPPWSRQRRRPPTRPIERRLRRMRRPQPPFCPDGTERRIGRPKDAAEQKSCYSGKKKYHTVKNLLLINAALLILFLSDTYEGSAHDKRIADTTRYPLPPGSRLMQDIGFLAFSLDGVEIIMPTKKPRGGSLTDEQKAENQQIAR